MPDRLSAGGFQLCHGNSDTRFIIEYAGQATKPNADHNHHHHTDKSSEHSGHLLTAENGCDLSLGGSEEAISLTVTINRNSVRFARVGFHATSAIISSLRLSPPSRAPPELFFG